MFNGDDDDDDEFLKLYHQKRLAQLKEESEKYVLGTRLLSIQFYFLYFERSADLLY